MLVLVIYPQHSTEDVSSITACSHVVMETVYLQSCSIVVAAVLSSFSWLLLDSGSVSIYYTVNFECEQGIVDLHANESIGNVVSLVF